MFMFLMTTADVAGLATVKLHGIIFIYSDPVKMAIEANTLCEELAPCGNDVDYRG